LEIDYGNLERGKSHRLRLMINKTIRGNETRKIYGIPEKSLQIMNGATHQGFNALLRRKGIVQAPRNFLTIRRIRAVFAQLCISKRSASQSLLSGQSFQTGPTFFVQELWPDPPEKFISLISGWGFRFFQRRPPVVATGNYFGQCRMGLVWVEKNRSPRRGTYSKCVNLFDRHRIFIVGSFWVNGPGLSMIPFILLRMAALKDNARKVDIFQPKRI
jgi:hypothetical protein